jgi:uncharacterized protein involved in exopolysaccharide biosynthesis
VSNPAVPEPEGEQEVDLASAWGRLKARWWLPVAGLVVGAIIGLLLAISGGSVWQAKTVIYLGQPFAPEGGQILSLATNPRTVSEIVHSEAALKQAAHVSGMHISRLRSGVSTTTIVQTGQPKGISPLVEIGVTGSGAHKTELAADSLAKSVTDRISSYVAAKVALLQQETTQDKSQIALAEQRIRDAQAAQAALTTDSSLSAVEKLLESSNLNNVIATAEQRLTSLQTDLYTAQQLLNLASSVEESHVVEPAASSKSTARSNRTAILVGAAIGLLIGIIAALVYEPIAARRRRVNQKA